MLGPLCNQTVNLKTHSKTLYYGILKLKYSPFLKHNTIKITRTGYFYKYLQYTCSDRQSIFASYGTDALIVFVSGDFYS